MQQLCVTRCLLQQRARDLGLAFGRQPVVGFCPHFTWLGYSLALPNALKTLVMALTPLLPLVSQPLQPRCDCLGCIVVRAGVSNGLCCVLGRYLRLDDVCRGVHSALEHVDFVLVEPLPKQQGVIDPHQILAILCLAVESKILPLVRGSSCIFPGFGVVE